ncbi:GNAT family N-acetyltransferase [Halomonas sp. MCCC 1A11036]|uniref:GNAT family N-acetyltransferase n=1 Tax=Billgrantia zhangzhouensis TaxID=2733481 RepID=A0ABS9AIC7_9GAMM|nr:GNAT family N-acetyltransferase [Halomonas zhangzhouensis]MCE8021400.1 GNAT family N-acetyltransferase [Halomonas zhangzhouensis]
MSARLIRLEKHHIAQAVRLSTEVGWPHRIQDWHLLMTLGQGYALVEEQTLIGTVLYWSFSAQLATLGSVLVSPVHQRKGLGKRLAEAAMASITASRIELYSTTEGIGLYRALGFSPSGWVHQCQGMSRRDGDTLLGANPFPPHGVRLVLSRDAKALSALDVQAVGSPRHELLHALLEEGEALVMEEPGGQLAGFALNREFGHGHVIGPVIALTPRIAQTLIDAWLEQLAGRFVRLDTPDAELSNWLAKRGLKEVGRVQCMVAGDTLPSTGPACRYALASHALG